MAFSRRILGMRQEAQDKMLKEKRKLLPFFLISHRGGGEIPPHIQSGSVGATSIWSTLTESGQKDKLGVVVTKI